jgi:hypothetical protein
MDEQPQICSYFSALIGTQTQCQLPGRRVQRICESSGVHGAGRAAANAEAPSCGHGNYGARQRRGDGRRTVNRVKSFSVRTKRENVIWTGKKGSPKRSVNSEWLPAVPTRGRSASAARAGALPTPRISLWSTSGRRRRGAVAAPTKPATILPGRFRGARAHDPAGSGRKRDICVARRIDFFFVAIRFLWGFGSQGFFDGSARVVVSNLA